MKKYLLSCFLLSIMSASFGQTTKEKIDLLKKDPKTTENAAKADAGLINKKNVTDSHTLKINTRKHIVGCKLRKQKVISN